MTENDEHTAGWEGYRAIGLVDNPFRLPARTGPDEVGIKLTTRAASLKLLTAIEEVIAGDRPRPVRVLKSSTLPAYYPRSAMTTTLRELGEGSETGLLPVYVQLIMMRKGRIRGTLSALAELVVGRSIDLTIARYAQRALSEPDALLPEWNDVAALDVADLLDRFESEPAATVAEVFGAPVELRENVAGGLAEVMRNSGMRQAHQPIDPQEDDATSEEDAAEKLAAMVDDSEGPAEDEATEEDPAAHEAAVVSAYVIAHLKKHVSPVLGRGLRAYVLSGTAAMSQELKVTRAPRKTLGAIARFAKLTFRSVVIIYDGFEAWDDIPDDQRAIIVSGLSEIRFALGADGVIVIAGSEAEAPEIDDQFATAIRVDWTMPELQQVEVPDTACGYDVFAGWLQAATLPGADTSALRARVERVCAGSETLSAGAALAAEEIEKAAAEAMGG
ncbi:MAG: hypothetical protein RQ731_07855 [Anaerosomatales bacterium]|nr:hypothetical protein [Anaerosomatales bacterium]MDT8434651.1 hypothetical protein [Anaerosomatales bacterium]